MTIPKPGLYTRYMPEARVNLTVTSKTVMVEVIASADEFYRYRVVCERQMGHELTSIRVYNEFSCDPNETIYRCKKPSANKKTIMKIISDIESVRKEQEAAENFEETK